MAFKDAIESKNFRYFTRRNKDLELVCSLAEVDYELVLRTVKNKTFTTNIKKLRFNADSVKCVKKDTEYFDEMIVELGC